MRVGVYVDGYNLYYGARALCGRGTQRWRWLDIRGLARSLISLRNNWAESTVERVIFSTARIDAASNPSGQADQDVYLKALVASGSVDHIEYGSYVSRVKIAPLAVEDKKGRPVLVKSAWPVKVQNDAGRGVADATFIVSHARREEKGSDVNVASHLLVDCCDRRIDAAIVISNDSDLRYPLMVARDRIPVGVVNPSNRQLAGDLRGEAADGVGRHWWRQLRREDLYAHQLPDPVGRYVRPLGW